MNWALLILQAFSQFTYVTAHSQTLLSPLLRHRIFTYVTWRAAQQLNTIGTESEDALRGYSNSNLLVMKCSTNTRDSWGADKWVAAQRLGICWCQSLLVYSLCTKEERKAKEHWAFFLSHTRMYRMCLNSHYRLWESIVGTKTVKFCIGTHVRKHTASPLQTKYRQITYWTRLLLLLTVRCFWSENVFRRTMHSKSPVVNLAEWYETLLANKWLTVCKAL